VKRKPSGSIEFLSIDIQDDEKRKNILKKLNRFGVKEIKRGEDTFYQINPTPAQLMELIDAGYFSGPELYRIDTH
jgi:hypothetical protein